jgi:TatD DNase family protein
MLFDSHAHLNFEDFIPDWQAVIADCRENDVWLVNVGAQYKTSERAIEIAEKYPQGVYAAVGLHPIHTLGSKFHPEEFKADDYRRLIRSSKKVVAIGETGIDFFHDPDNIGQQAELFRQHLRLAKEFGLPLIIHARNSKDGTKDAYNAILDILKKESGIRGVIHCFSGTVEQAQAFLKLGFYVGFTGIITFDKTGRLAAVIDSLPLEAILIETDCPFLAPEPHRGERNQPQYVQFVAEKIAMIKEIGYNEVVSQTGKNAFNLFNLS